MLQWTKRFFRNIDLMILRDDSSFHSVLLIEHKRINTILFFTHGKV